MNKYSGVFTGLALARAAVAGLALLIAPGVASAQLAPVGSTIDVASFFVRGVDVAFDPSTNGYLVVGAQNTVIGVCVNANGTPTAAPITIKPASATFGAFPRARYSPHANGGRGAFLVVWPEETSTSITLHARMVSCADGLLGSEQIISGDASAWLESGAAIAYSAVSRRFLVAWKSFPPDPVIKARLVEIDATGVGSVLTLSSGFGRDPGVTWNSASDEFGVSFSGETPTVAYTAFVRVPAGNPAAFQRTTFNVIAGGLTTATDIDYNPTTNRYVMTWFEYPGAYTRSAEFDAAGSLVEQRLASATLGSYDALSLAFNPISGTFLIVGVERVDDDVVAAELDARGVRTSPETRVSSSGRPNRYTRVASSAVAAQWNGAFNSRSFLAMSNQVVESSTRGGGGGGNPPPPPPPPPATPMPRMNIDIPSINGRVPGNGFTVAGWAIDAASTSGTGVSTVHIWAYPTSGATPSFLGVASNGIARPDVAAAFGSSQFTSSGFALAAHLTPGDYDLAAFPYSTVANGFTAAQIRRVTVEAPVSIPRMWVDSPRAGDNVSQNIQISGWAIDIGSTSGNGVSTVHVWAYPASGGPAMFVGAGSPGWARPDVGAAFASSRFTNSGFSVQGTLPRGDYTLVVYAYSSVVRAFNNVFVVPVRVN